MEQNTKDFIVIKGAHLHNLKHIDVAIPKNKLVVVTGVSGSGKSTLAFDTIYAEGQRRYVESLSSYARQFLGKLEKPMVEYIKGLAPAIAIQQKVISSNPRSTVGTTTEIYDYLRLLFARVGKTYSPISGEIVKKDEVSDVVNYIQTLPKNEQYILTAPLVLEKIENFNLLLQTLKSQGFVRLEVDSTIISIEDLVSFNFQPKQTTKIQLVIDRFQVSDDEEWLQRLADSIQIAFYEGKGYAEIKKVNSDKNEKVEVKMFSNTFESDGIVYNEPNIHFFSFNNPYGACPKCEGYGQIIGIDENLVIPNKNLSLFEDAVVAWKGEKMQEWKNDLIKVAGRFNFPIHKPYYQLSTENLKDLWQGNSYFEGINGFFKMVEENAYKIQYRVMLSRYRGKTKCPECSGKRLRIETENIKINAKSLMDLVELPLNELAVFFKNITLSEYEQKIARRLLLEINNRIEFLLDVGLGYLDLNRASNTLSGGESQRINLATSLGSSLVGSIYILDEPSIGLHSRDTHKLIQVLTKLRDLGNTVIVVEHDEEIMKVADYIIDIGPEAGSLGGEITFKGAYSELSKSNSLTAKYLSETEKIDIPKNRRKIKNFIEVKGARSNNLKNIDVKFPLDCLLVITGVSGSGKSTLMKDILHPFMERELGSFGNKIGEFSTIEGNINNIKAIELVDQNPIGKSSRSNPITYVKAFDDIRNLYSRLKQSKLSNFQPKHFSFNVEGGRCETCKGEGTITVEMQFMADIELVCETCNGKRFKREILDVRYEEVNISELLDMTITEGLDFFKKNNQDKIYQKIAPLEEVGLGYLKLGQSSNTLSGGEAQRIKLASFLVKGVSESKTLFIFDEPTTGLHFHDVKKLLKSLNALIENGHSVMVIEHHLDVIKSADWVIDLGPDAGKHGGELVAEGTPEDICKNKKSITGKYLKGKLLK